MGCHKVRWLAAEISHATLWKLAKGMRENAYSAKSGYGFLLHSSRKDYLEGTFVEKRESKVKFHDNIIGDISYKTVEIRKFNFRIAVSFPNFELVDPPRTVGLFLDLMGQFCPGELFFENILVEPEHWLQRLESVWGKVRVVSFLTNSVSLSTSAKARVEINGSEDIRDKWSFVFDEKPAIHKLKFIRPSNVGLYELSSEGRAVCPRLRSEDITELRAALAELVAANRLFALVAAKILVV
jgi:hypothetical protein